MKKIFALLFAFSLIIFSVLNMLKPETGFSETENRYLAKLPDFTFEKLLSGEYTKEFEKYATDQVIMRDFLVGIKSNSEKLMGKYENNGVYFCDDGYLIEKMPAYNEEILKKNIKGINDLAKTGKYNVSFSLIPTAFEVLKDKLPPYAYADIQNKVFEYAKENLKNVTLIDSYNSLRENNEEYIYYRTDHHQTMNGSFIVYRDIIKSLGMTPYEKEDFIINEHREEFFGTTWSKTPVSVKGDKIITYIPEFDISYEVTYEDTGIKKDSLYVTENLDIKDKYTYYLGGNNSVVKIKTSLANGKKIAVIKDSYAHSILPVMANHYEEIYVIDLRYYSYNIDDYLTKNKITDVLFIYNTSNFLTDTNLVKISAYLK